MNIFSRTKRSASTMLRVIAPTVWISLHAGRMQRKRSEQEVRLLPLLIDPAEASIDVGCNVGDYAYHMRKLSARVYAFEPNPRLVKWIRRSFGKTVTVFEIALSDSAGVARLAIPLTDSGVESDGHGSIESAVGALGRTVSVPKKRLDDIALPKIGFMKIDVEGHEFAVLRGAANVLRRDIPSLLVEIEERHRNNAIKSIEQYLRRFGYAGHYFLNGHIFPIETFCEGCFQNPRNLGPAGPLLGKVYINNFIFVARRNVQQRVAERMSPNPPCPHDLACEKH